MASSHTTENNGKLNRGTGFFWLLSFPIQNRDWCFQTEIDFAIEQFKQPTMLTHNIRPPISYLLWVSTFQIFLMHSHHVMDGTF